jgi:hypothetical protein
MQYNKLDKRNLGTMLAYLFKTKKAVGEQITG